jgi:tubulin monoglycylase TTLL3/8
MHNHLENNWNLSNKKALFYNMRAYYDAINEDYDKYLPLTFHIQNGT